MYKIKGLASIFLTMVLITVLGCQAQPVTTTINTTITEPASTITQTLPASTLTTTVTKTATVTNTSTSTTFGQLALKGEQSYNYSCTRCHGSNHVGTYSSSYLSIFKHAQGLLNKIGTMPAGGQQDQWEILSYLLVKNNWVSGDTIFNPDTLFEILIPK